MTEQPPICAWCKTRPGAYETDDPVRDRDEHGVFTLIEADKIALLPRHWICEECDAHYANFVDDEDDE